MLGIILAVAVIYLLICLNRPAWGLAIILALLPSYQIRFNILNIPTTALEIMVGVFLLSSLFLISKKQIKEQLSLLGTTNYWVLGFLVAGIISTVISPEPIKALGQLKALVIEPILLFYAALLVIKPHQYQLLTKSLFVSSTLLSVFGLVQYWMHILLPLRFWGYGAEVKRIVSLFEYPNAFALFLAPLFVFFIVLYVKNSLPFKSRWVILWLCVMGAALLLTYSRGAWLGVGAGLIVASLNTVGFSWRRWSVWASIAIIIIVPLTINRLKNTFQDKASSERLALYQAAGQQIVSNPLLGNGLYGFRTTLQHTPNYKGEILNYPHNILLNFWVELGLLGVLMFALLVMTALRSGSLGASPYKYAAALFVITTLVHGLVDVPYFKNDLSILYWFIFTISFGPPIPRE